MAFELPPLPYEYDALAPHISKETLHYHHDKHHKAYVDKLNGLIPDTKYADKSLEGIIVDSTGPIFNNAAQIWNHTFYWHCMMHEGGGEPKGELADAIKDAFGSFQAFKDKFTEASINQFGSGWAWLAKNHQGKLEVFSTGNAGTPMVDDKIALLTCDVWEHAYYIDYKNERAKYVANFWDVVNWDFVAKNLSKKDHKI